MKIEQKTLNYWAELALKTNKNLLDGSANYAQVTNNLLLQSLKHAGADDPIFRPKLERSGNPEIPLNLLDSSAARRYASAIRAAATACREMETERGIEDGLAEQLECFAESAELEVYGPVGLEGPVDRTPPVRNWGEPATERGEMLRLIHNMKLALPDSEFRREVDKYVTRWLDLD